MVFSNTPPKWDAAGAEPSADLQTSGFTAGYKPPAAYFNYLFNQYTKCIAEIQDKMIEEVLTANADLDDYIDVGMYTCSLSTAGTIANAPEVNQFTLFVLPRLKDSDTSNRIHVVITQSNIIYVRNLVDGVWGGWSAPKMDAQPPFIEIIPSTSADHGGFIDFHYAGASDDYTSRIIESAKGVLNILAALKVKGKNVHTEDNLTIEDFKNIKFQHHNAENDHRLIIYCYVTDTTFWRVDIRARDNIIQYRYFIDSEEQFNLEIKPSDLYLPLVGGTLFGNLKVANGSVALAGDDSAANVMAYSDVASDYKRTIQLMNESYNEDIASSLILIQKNAAGSKNYKIYGEHNKPKVEDIGAVSRTLLWTNSNPISSFVAQTVNISSLSQYDGIEIVFMADYLDQGVKSTGFIPYQSSGNLTMDCVLTDGAICFDKRVAIMSDSGIRFKIGNRLTVNSPSHTLAENNAACIPYKIYGIKGVK